MARLFNVSVLLLAAMMESCGGNSHQEQAASDSSKTAAPASIAFETSSLETIFQYAQPLQLTADEQVLTKPRSGDTSVVTLSSGTAFIDYLAQLKAAKHIRYDAWELNDLIYNEMIHGDRRHTISNQNLLDRKVLTAKELKYYQLWFVITLRESSVYPQDAYQKIYTKLNDICKDCIPLEEAQIQVLQEKLKTNPQNFGIFEVLSAQQMNSYGIL